MLIKSYKLQHQQLENPISKTLKKTVDMISDLVCLSLWYDTVGFKTKDKENQNFSNDFPIKLTISRWHIRGKQSSSLH